MSRVVLLLREGVPFITIYIFKNFELVYAPFSQSHKYSHLEMDAVQVQPPGAQAQL